MVIRLSDMVPGHKMCCICFEYTPFEDLYIDADGTWDVCKPCEREQHIVSELLAKGWDRDRVILHLGLIRALTRPYSD